MGAQRGLIRIAPELTLNEADRSFFTITIDDDGPGLAADLREAAPRRGRRLDETKPGSGPRAFRLSQTLPRCTVALWF